LGTIFTVTPYKLSEEAKSILKIKGDFSFFAIRTDVLKKHNVESFGLISDKNNLKLEGVQTPNQASVPQERGSIHV